MLFETSPTKSFLDTTEYNIEGIQFTAPPTPVILSFDIESGWIEGFSCSLCIVEIYGTSSKDGEIFEGQASSDDKLKEILANPNTTIHTIEFNSNNYGEILFLTTSKGAGQKRICMTFWGLGYHDYRERWIHQEWFSHQTPASLVDPLEKIGREEAQELINKRAGFLTCSLI